MYEGRWCGDPLPTQRVPLCTILKCPFLAKDPKIFLKALLASIYIDFEVGTRAKKNVIFLVNIIQKLLKNAVFQNFACGCGTQNLVKIGSL